MKTRMNTNNNAYQNTSVYNFVSIFLETLTDEKDNKRANLLLKIVCLFHCVYLNVLHQLKRIFKLFTNLFIYLCICRYVYPNCLIFVFDIILRLIVAEQHLLQNTIKIPMYVSTHRVCNITKIFSHLTYVCRWCVCFFAVYV